MNIQTRTPTAQGYSPRQIKSNFNQKMAEAHQSADPSWAAKGLDRPGSSRGAGRKYMAGIQSAQNLANGISEAYTQQANDQAFNASVNLANQQLAEGTGLEAGAIAMQQNYADALAAIQRQQQVQGILGGLLGSGSGGLNSFLGF